MPLVMRRSVIRTHLWPSLSEMSGWLKSGPVKYLDGQSITHHHSTVALTRLKTIKRQLESGVWTAFAIRRVIYMPSQLPYLPNLITTSLRHHVSNQVLHWINDVWHYTLQCVDSCVFAPKKEILSHTSSAPSVYDSLDIICTTCFPVQHTGDENINEMPEDWWLTGCCVEKRKKKGLQAWTSAKRQKLLSDQAQDYQAMSGFRSWWTTDALARASAMADIPTNHK